MLAERPYTIHLARLGKAAAHVEHEIPNPRIVAQQWITKLEAALASKDMSRLGSIMHQDCWLRDMLVFEWDFHTISGLERVAKYIGQNIDHSTPYNLKLHQSGHYVPAYLKPIDGLEWIESMFSFETQIGGGSGMLRIVQGADGLWKGYVLYTALTELKGFEEKAGTRRSHGGNNSLLDGEITGNWMDRRHRQIEFLDEEPQVFIVGAGQAGLNLGARLQALGLSCLIVDKNKRVGDNWRHRYRLTNSTTLVTHDPVQYTHMAYLPFPPNWPLFTPKDKLGDWFESYATLMELNVWTNTCVNSAEYNEENGEWLVTVDRGSEPIRKLKPRHVVMCTGHSGEPRIPAFPGQNDFQGEVYHGSQHQDASLSSDIMGKKVVVVGTGNSGHDIAQNFYENGADVTMLQRSGTYVISAATGLFMLHEGIYDETGPPTEEADIFSQSLPTPIQFALNVKLTSRIAAAEKTNFDGLKKAGFEIDFGEDGSGIYRKYVTRGGGYYIDVGGSQLIIDGKIKLASSPCGIKGFEPTALVLADGRKLDADIVVLATGYDNMLTTARKCFGDKVADRCDPVWDLDEEGEIRAMWRPSGHPRFWFMGGSLALCRIYSRFLALQIMAVEGGMNDGCK